MLKVQKLFGISSVQFSTLVTSLSGKFVQLSSGHGGPNDSVQFVQFSSFSSRTLPALARIDLAGSVQPRESPIILEE